jgi:ABC-type lipopolysaccharide export system ATPase subunit
MHLGAVIEDGTPDEVRASELVQQTYLGASPDAPDLMQGGALR